MAAVLLSVSTILQYAAAAAALWLVRRSERKLPWLCVAVAVLLMGARRTITLVRVLAGDSAHPPDVAAESVALLISALMLVGIMGVILTSGDKAPPAGAKQVSLLLKLGGAIAFLCATIWMNELVDLPRLLLGVSATPSNWAEALVESGLAIVVGVYVVSSALQHLSERTQAEQDLRESEGFTRTVMDHLPVGVAVNSVDPTVSFSYMNDSFANLYRTTREALEDQDAFWEAVYEDPEFRERIKKRVLKDCAGGDPQRMYWTDIPITRKGEETTFISARNTPIPGKKLMVSTVWDVTDRKRAEDQLQAHRGHLEELVEQRTTELQRYAAQLGAANRELEAFAYSVSHDLRAPLRGMDGFSEALLQDYGDRLDDTGRDYARRVRAASRKMGRLIDDILQLSRVSRHELEHETVDLSELARAAVDDLRKRDPDRRVDVSIQGGLRAQGDARLLSAMVQNLLGNAWKFTRDEPDPRIEVGAAPNARCGAPHADLDDDARVFFVRDNGAGFDMEYVDKLFEPFQRLHSGSEFSGTGIGLATVQRVARRHGGRVWAQGAPGQGAAFYFTLDAQTESGEEGAQR